MNYYATRGNKVLKINEDAVARYLGQGYTITDEGGKVVKKGTPQDTNLLAAEFKKQEAELASLKDENTKLKAELKAAKAEVVELKSEIEKFKSASVSTSEPKSTRKRRQATADVESEE